MSKLVIINHVKEGVHYANQYKLYPSIVDFIQQHHGTSLVYYFYQQAVKDKIEAKDDTPIEEEIYRYPGPKPQSKETAVVMLADAVEAAVRSINEINPSKIKNMVYQVFEDKFRDGQLNESDLTLKEIDGLSYEEISRAMRISLNKVKIWLFRARQKLKKKMPKFYPKGANYDL